MMAKMFYRFDEARQVLGMSDEQLKQLTREGKLREFRDGAQVMYKADQVDQLKAEMGLGDPDAVDLGPSDTGGPIGLSDTRGSGLSGTLGGTVGGSLGGTSGGSVISLADSTSKDDTAADMGLSGSGSGTGLDLAASSGGSASGIGLAGSTSGGTRGGTKSGTAVVSSPSGSGSGVSVLGLDEGGTADPSAATAMGGSFAGEPSLEAMGSGSGLLDLSRERDDTSLGAPVLHELSGGSRTGSSVGSFAATPISGGASAAAAARAGGVPVYVEQSDNFSGFAAGAAFAAAAVAVVAIYVLAAGALRAQPTLLSFMYTPQQSGAHAAPAMLYLLGGGVAAALVFGIIGFLVGKRR